jgi:mannose-1-phosphate guanylyltransferase
VKDHRWAIILAAGEGARIRNFMTDSEGRTVPKQFWPISGRESMLDWSIDRARSVVPGSRVVVVVADQHRDWWESALQRLPPENVVVQPENRGTAIGVLLPLLTVLGRDPDATIVIFPSDHFVGREPVLRSAVEEAFSAVDRGTPTAALLLGMVPDTDDREYGWILPGRRRADPRVTRVAAFVEKPSSSEAARLRRAGALINSLVLIAKARRLFELCETSLPAVAESLAHVVPRSRTHTRIDALTQVYQRLPCLDFSREILATHASDLSVLPVRDCGWSDLGTPARLAMFRDNRSRERGHLQIDVVPA